MLQQNQLLFLYAETPVHAGSGRGLGSVDLPIQRERTTHYPIIQASSVKGCLRAEAEARINGSLTKDQFEALFGPETANASDHAGALSFGDARLLLLPVRSLSGVFAWTTCVDVLARFEREAACSGQKLTWSVGKVKGPAVNQVWVNTQSDLIIPPDEIALEEFSFKVDKSGAKLADDVATWLQQNAFPSVAAMPEYAYWQSILGCKLCILPDNAFRDFALYGMEIQTHIRLDKESKTVQQGALWTSESLPADSLLYTPITAFDSRSGKAKFDAAAASSKLAGLQLKRIQIGGDETTGAGIAALRFSPAGGGA